MCAFSSIVLGVRAVVADGTGPRFPADAVGWHLLVVLHVGVLLSAWMASPATAQYPWPVAPRHASHEITGTFSEYRGPDSPHFHNGVDVPKADGSPVYAVAGGRVTAVDPSGANAYVRIERFAYVHIVPNPALSVGGQVQAGDIVGTILSGQGHVHFTDGYVNSEREPLRPDGGLTPYEDPWAPMIDSSSIQFYHQPTRQRLASTRLTGAVEISVRIRERNGPPTARASRLNNGAHTVGYKILTGDRQQVVHAPSDDGVVFHFTTKPSNSYVHHVFDRLRGASTSDQIYLPTNAVTHPSAWDATDLEGDYTVMLFAGDTRGNADTVYVPVRVVPRDILPPPPATLLAVTPEEGHPHFRWTSGTVEDQAGFRIYASATGATPWALLQGEGVIEPSARTYADAAPLADATYFHVTAVDTSTNESATSDVYGAAPFTAARRLLIVDGFDRSSGSGSWQQAWHAFAAAHGRALAASGFGFATCANEAVVDGRVALADYDAVIWFLGDESTADETFSTAEQALVQAFLEGGGRLFVSGSEIAWDLGQRGSAADQAFLNQYLKVAYAGDDAGSYRVQGTDDGLFADLDFRYGGSPYSEDYPDYYAPAAGGQPALRYDNDRVAGVQYEGPFGTGSTSGRLVILGFPFETIRGATTQDSVMARVLGFFFPEAVAAEPPAAARPERLVLHPSYPNPFREQTTLSFALPRPGRVTLTVYDVLGRRVAVAADGAYAAGDHTVTWTPDALPSGTYFVRLEADGRMQTRTLTRLN